MANATFVTASFATMNAKKGAEQMKMLNYDTRALLLQNIRQPEKSPEPTRITKTQYEYLCKLIKRKKITKPFFEFLLSELYHEKDWRQLTYKQMYELIHVLTFYEYHE